MSFEINNDWVKAFATSASEYAAELVKNVESAMTDHVLDDVDAHACALAAALASGNGGLAFEISMDKVLFGNEIREVVAKAILFESMNANYIAYATAARNEGITVDTTGFHMDNFTQFGGIEPDRFLLFCFVAATVNRSEVSVQNKLSQLKHYGVPHGKIQSAARIASIIPAIGNCLL